MTLTQRQENFFWSILWFWALTQGISTSLSIVCSLVMMLFSIYMLFSWREKVFSNNPGKLYFIFSAFALMMLISLLVNRAEIPHYMRSLSKMRYFLLPILSLPWLLLLKPKENYRSKLLDALILLSVSYALASVAGLIAVFGCFQINHWLSECTERAPGLTGIMQYAFETPLIMLLALQAVFTYKDLLPKKKKLLEICIILMFMGLFLSNSRGAAVGLVVGLVPWIALHLKKISKEFVVKFLLISSIILSACYLIRPKVFQESRIVSRAADMTTTLAKESANIRMTLNKKSLEAFKHRPILGYGLLHPKSDYDGKTSLGIYYFMIDTHNTYTQVLVDGGIISFIAYMAFWILLLWRTWKSNNRDAKLFLIPWIIFAATSGVHSMLVTGTGTAVLLFFLMITNIVLIEGQKKVVKNVNV